MSHFGGRAVSDAIREQHQSLRQAVPAMSEEILLVPTESIVSELVDLYGLRVPTIYPERAEVVEGGEAPRSAGAVRVVFAIPFDGQPGVFELTPSQHRLASFNGAVRGDDLLFTISLRDATKESIESALGQQVELYETELSQLRRDLEQFNGRLSSDANILVEARKEQILKARDVLASLEFPVRRREDAVIPVPVSRRVQISVPARATSGSYAPEPEVAMVDYEEILASTRSMGLVMERAPGTFSDLAEEGIRDFFLALLNFGFRGEAMAEVFNGEGKTDILIRVREKNVFIAECKVWYTPKRFMEALDQLLGYLGWRDTKCAILLFVHERDVSDVRDAADAVIRRHESFRRDEMGAVGELERRYRLHWPGDDRRELHLTLQIFAVPTTTPTRARRRLGSATAGSPGPDPARP